MLRGCVRLLSFVCVVAFMPHVNYIVPSDNASAHNDFWGEFDDFFEQRIEQRNVDERLDERRMLLRFVVWFVPQQRLHVLRRVVVRVLSRQVGVVSVGGCAGKLPR